jgi:hypothetical protein
VQEVLIHNFPENYGSVLNMLIVNSSENAATEQCWSDFLEVLSTVSDVCFLRAHVLIRPHAIAHQPRALVCAG